VSDVGIKELLEAGVHFGHQTRRWNPRMRRYIFGERGGIHIIDLQKTQRLLEEAREFAGSVAARGGTILFVGTKKQARDTIGEIASAAGMPYVDQRWLGGLLTNFGTISGRIERLHQLAGWREDGTLELLPVRERIAAEAELEKLETNLGGVRDMQRVPDAVFVVDLKTEAIAVREAQRLGVPIIAICDTNTDASPVAYPIPGNDDAIRSCRLIIEAIGDVVRANAARFRAEEERARREAEEQRRREEERRRREEEEAARRQAEEAAARQAEAEGPGPHVEAEPAVRAAASEPAAGGEGGGRAPAQGSPAESSEQAAPDQATSAAAPAEAEQANETPEDRSADNRPQEART
jgi:small subunit ribosomal protein S2